MLSLTEEWAEAMKAVIENNMAKISDTLEKSLTNGLGFDKLMDDFDKLNTRQEEFLTKTNKIEDPRGKLLSDLLRFKVINYYLQ